MVKSDIIFLGGIMTTQQWIALGIFALSYGLIISEKVSRTIASICGAVLAFIFILTGTWPASPALRRGASLPKTSCYPAVMVVLAAAISCFTFSTHESFSG